MELVPIHKRVIGLDIHQAQITACAILEESGGETRIEQRQFRRIPGIAIPNRPGVPSFPRKRESSQRLSCIGPNGGSPLARE
jgi:hypothetical protein